MSATIGQRVFASGSQSFLALRNDEYVRQMAIGRNWTRLRIGLLFAAETAGGTFLGTDFTLGVCNYPYGPMAWNCNNWIGGGLVDSAQVNPWTYTGGATPYYTAGSFSRARVGATATQISGNVGANNFAANPGTSPRRSIWVLDITKGANYTINAWGTFSAGLVVQDWSYANLVEATQQVGTQYGGMKSGIRCAKASLKSTMWANHKSNFER